MKILSSKNFGANSSRRFSGAGLTRFFSIVLTLLAIIAGVLFVAETARAEGEVNIYSYRKEVLIQPLLRAFTEETGIQTRLVSGKADVLLERLKAEGRNSAADVLLTVDAGRLHRAQEADVLQKVTSPKLNELVPPQYRHPEGYWYGLSLRARFIVYALDRVDPMEISDYADLAKPEWKGRVCIRSSGNIYNQSLLAAMIEREGSEWTETWAKGLVANFAREPVGGDRDQIKAVAAGECDVAVVNSYYLGRMLSSDGEQLSTAQAVGVIWPDQEGWGAHVNVSGAGVTKSAKNLDNAIRLIEFLAGDTAQQIYAGEVYEFPLNPDIPLAPVVEAWGPFKADRINLSILGLNNAEAVRIADRVGWQ